MIKRISAVFLAGALLCQISACGQGQNSEKIPSASQQERVLSSESFGSYTEKSSIDYNITEEGLPQSSYEENSTQEQTSLREESAQEISSPEEETSAIEEEAAPPFVWERADPEAYGLPASVISDLHGRYPRLPVLSSIICRQGVILDEYYADGYDENSLFILNSASKSITSALMGIAIDQGLIESVDTPIIVYFPQLAAAEDPRASEITIRHLLTHTTGFSSTDDDNWDAWRSSDNWVDYVLSQPITAEPGTTFRYFTGNTHLLSAIIQSVSGMTAYEFAVQNLFLPLGIEDSYCDTDPQGISDGGNGFHLHTRDMAKIGLLYIQGGVWQGEQIISSEWVSTSTSLQFKRNTGTADHGFGWWVRTFGNAAYPAFFAQGHAGQYIFVIPDLELVIAITSNYEGSTDVYWDYINEIVNAIG